MLKEESVGTTFFPENGTKEVKTPEGTRLGVSINVIVQKISEKYNWWKNPWKKGMSSFYTRRDSKTDSYNKGGI